MSMAPAPKSESANEGVDILPRICVRKPYFALRNLRLNSSGSASCDIPVEQPVGSEVSPISLSESGRHMAILGLCAAASSAPDDERRYYLARRAKITWLHPTPSEAGGRLTGSVLSEFTSKRKAAAEGTLFADGVPLAGFELGYDVLTVPAFERMFSHAHRPDALTTTARNPYRRPLEMTDVSTSTTSVTTLVKPTVPDCVGHFPGYPTLPVAVLGGVMTETASRLIEIVTDSPGVRWIPMKTDLQAHKLVKAGIPVTAEARLIRLNQADLRIAVVAATEDGEIATVSLDIAVESAATP